MPVTNGTVAGITITDATWVTWSNVSTTTASTATIWVNWSASNTTSITGCRFGELTEEDRAASRERTRLAAKAVARAEALLVAHLAEDQANEWRERRQFHVVGSRGNRYRIRCGRVHNVHQVTDDGRAAVEFCGHVRDYLPDADNVLAQKLLLEHDEAEFLRIANRRELVAA